MRSRRSDAEVRATSTASSAARAAASLDRSVVAAKPQVPSWRTRTDSPADSRSAAPSSWRSRTRASDSRIRSTRTSAWLAPAAPGLIEGGAGQVLEGQRQEGSGSTRPAPAGGTEGVGIAPTLRGSG